MPTRVPLMLGRAAGIPGLAGLTPVDRSLRAQTWVPHHVGLSTCEGHSQQGSQLLSEPVLKREHTWARSQSLSNLISKVTSSHFCCVVLLRSESLGPAHTPGERVPQRSHTRDWDHWGLAEDAHHYIPKFTSNECFFIWWCSIPVHQKIFCILNKRELLHSSL